MKRIFLLLLISFFQLNAQQTKQFNAAELYFIQVESESNNVYFLENPRMLIAFSEGNFSIFKKGKTYTFTCEAYSDSNYKFNILNNEDKVVGNVLINDLENYDVILFFDNKKLVKHFGRSVTFSSGNKVKPDK